MYTTKDKYLPLKIDVKSYPTIIIGQNPGKTRKGKYSPYVWDGDTRTSNLLREAVEGYDNIILTNICNYQDLSKDNLFEGWRDFQDLYREHMPKRIICLGEFSFNQISMLVSTRRIIAYKNGGTAIYKIQHPSYIVRFNKNKEEYVEKIRSLLDEKTLHSRGSRRNRKNDSLECYFSED